MTADVTLVIATYNRPAMLKVELLSILASAAMVPKTNVRILVVDDASETLDAKHVCTDLWVEYLRLPHNLGVAGALAAGFEQVDSPYYALWGDDDFFLPRWFPLHLAKMAEGYDVVAGSYWKAGPELHLKRQVILPPATFAALRQGTVTCNDGSLVRRDSLGDIQFRPERERAMMMTFWQAMAAKGAKFTSLTEPTWLYRRHETNLSNHRSEHDNQLRQAATADYDTRWIDAFG